MKFKKEENQTKKNKSTPHSVATIILLIAILIASVLATYALARYIQMLTSNSTADVAKWRFELKDGVAETADIIDFPVTRTDDKSNVVKPGTIGPRNLGRNSNNSSYHRNGSAYEIRYRHNNKQLPN